jgi:hypothetical protein
VPKGVIIIVVGLASTVVLAFASYQSKSGAVRVLFWIALLATAGVIVYSGIAGIRSELFIRSYNETLPVVAMSDRNEDCSPVRIHR